MIVTLTANPSLDRTVALDAPLLRGQVLRVRPLASEPAGKGVNVVRAVAAAGAPALAVLPGGPEDPVVVGLHQLGIAHRAVGIDEPVRVNLTVTEPDGTTTKINEPGPVLGPAVLDALVAALLAEAEGASWMALCGSLPPGPDAGWYGDLVRALRARGTRVAVDTSGAPLLALRDAGREAQPDLLKPNAEELAELTGYDEALLEADPAAVVAAADELRAAGAADVLVTLGGAGAVLVTAEGAWRAVPAPVRAVSTVGAGDCTLAGYLLASVEGAGPAERLRRAVSYGTAAATLPGSAVPTPAQAAERTVEVSAL